MKPSINDKAEGGFHEMNGKVKEKAGQLANDRGLEAEGIVETAAGKVQGILTGVKKDLEKLQCRPVVPRFWIGTSDTPVKYV